MDVKWYQVLTAYQYRPLGTPVQAVIDFPEVVMIYIHPISTMEETISQYNRGLIYHLYWG